MIENVENAEKWKEEKQFTQFQYQQTIAFEQLCTFSPAL